MVKAENEDERRRAVAVVRYLRERYGVTYWPGVMIVYAMAYCVPERGYREVLSDWSSWACRISKLPQRSAELWHSEIFRCLLRAGIDMPNGVGQWFDDVAKEMREHENGISFRP